MDKSNPKRPFDADDLQYYRHIPKTIGGFFEVVQMCIGVIACHKYPIAPDPAKDYEPIYDESIPVNQQKNQHQLRHEFQEAILKEFFRVVMIYGFGQKEWSLDHLHADGTFGILFSGKYLCMVGVRYDGSVTGNS